MGKIAIFFLCAAALAQTPAKSTSKATVPVTSAGGDAKACKLFSIPELQAFFGATVVGVKGVDTATTSLCAYRFIDARHLATLEIHPPNATEQAITPQQQIDYLGQTMYKGKAPESKIYGHVGCYKVNAKAADKPLPSTVCFQSAGGYLALSIGSDDPNQTSFEVVRSLFAKIAARRK